MAKASTKRDLGKELVLVAEVKKIMSNEGELR